VDARTKLETKAYASWLTGTFYFETGEWSEAKSTLSQAQTIYESLSQAVGEEEGNLFRQKMDEIAPSLRYCAYNIGDVSAKDDLMKMRGDGANLELDSLIAQTREQQAATLQDVDWKGRKMAVKQEKVRLFLLSYQESGQELARAKDSNAKLSIYENLLLQSKDAIQVLREDLMEDPEFRTRQQQSSGKVGSQHFLYTYLQYIRYTITVNRNNVLLDTMKRQLEGKEKQEEGKKVVKPQDVVRMYENIIQSLHEVTSLAGLEDDEELAQANQLKITFYRAFKSYYMAKAFIFAKKWAEAMTIFHRALELITNAREEGGLEKDMETQLHSLEQLVEENKFVAHANSILETEKVTDKMAVLEVSNKVPLVDRLDDYHEDSGLVKGKSNLVHFPPEFEPIPCKPLFFDLAINHLEMPDLNSKLEKKEDGKSSLGGWLGGWGWGKK
jgi:signal recognition particle subunit SRP68